MLPGLGDRLTAHARKVGGEWAVRRGEEVLCGRTAMTCAGSPGALCSVPACGPQTFITGRLSGCSGRRISKVREVKPLHVEDPPVQKTPEVTKPSSSEVLQ